MNTLFSIIIPTFNRGYILWKTIQSVQNQIYPNWELIIIDDGSTDDTQKVVAQFQDDKRINYYFIPNSGVTHARNVGLSKSKGEIITYLDSDDIFYNNFLSTAKEMFDKNPDKIFAITNYNFRIELYKKYKLVDVTREGPRQGDNLTLQEIYHWKVKCAYGTGMLHKRVVYDEGLKWDEKFTHFGDDWDFVMQMGNKYPNSFLYVPEILYEYHQRFGTDGKASLATYKDYEKGFEMIYQKHKNDPLMQGQEWYPRLVDKYKTLQEKLEKGESIDPVYKYFPNYQKKK